VFVQSRPGEIKLNESYLFVLNFVNVSRNLIALLCEEQSSLRVWEFLQVTLVSVVLV